MQVIIAQKPKSRKAQKKAEKPKIPKAQNYFGIPDWSRNPETILGFPKIWFGIGIEIGIPENFGLGIGTSGSVWDISGFPKIGNPEKLVWDWY